MNSLRRISPVSAGKRFARVLRSGFHDSHDKEGWMLGQHPGMSMPFGTGTTSKKRLKSEFTLTSFFAMGFILPGFAVWWQLSKGES